MTLGSALLLELDIRSVSLALVGMHSDNWKVSIYCKVNYKFVAVFLQMIDIQRAIKLTVLLVYLDKQVTQPKLICYIKILFHKYV
jgi:hypothetical protein